MEDEARFRGVAAELSVRFSGVAAERVDAEVGHALEQIAGCLRTDRCSLIEIRPEDGSVVVSHSWARPGHAPVAEAIRVAVIAPWYLGRLRRGEPLCFARLPDELPADAHAERAYVRELPMLSHIGVPLEVGGQWVCAVVTSTATTYRTWTDAEVEWLQVVGQVLANAIHRRDLELELDERFAELRRLHARLEAENHYLREAADVEAGFEGIAGRSPAIRAVLELAAQVAPMPTSVLLLGETGTGKEVLARAIHARSSRAERPLIKVNCAALPASLIESELFGHEKGAFTGATSTRPGRFELADGGTLFLDELGEIPPDVQVKLLRVLQDGEFERVGSVRTRSTDVRVVAATNRDLERAMAEGRFREDLYYRLSAFPIRVPPLRDRREDIPLLVWELIQHRQPELGRRIDRVPERAMQALVQYQWPGNVRELANVIERALILSPGSVLELEAAFGRAPRRDPGARLDDVERAHFVRVLEQCQWRISGTGNAADLLGLKPSTLRSRLKKLHVERPAVRSPA